MLGSITGGLVDGVSTGPNGSAPSTPQAAAHTAQQTELGFADSDPNRSIERSSAAQTQLSNAEKGEVQSGNLDIANNGGIIELEGYASVTHKEGFMGKAYLYFGLGVISLFSPFFLSDKQSIWMPMFCYGILMFGFAWRQYKKFQEGDEDA